MSVDATHAPGRMDALATEIGRCLLSPAPDTRGLVHRVAAGLGVPATDARRLIYPVALELNARFFPPIKKAELILTEGCNQACTYCFEKGTRSNRARRMTPEVARAAVDLLFDYAGDAERLDITHFGGEPLLNMPTLRAATAYARERAAAAGKTVEFNLTTNALRLDEAAIDYLAEQGIPALVSIDGMQASHDRYRVDRQGNGTWQRAMASLRRLKQRQPWVGVKMTVMPDNVGRLADDVRELHALGVNQFLIGHAGGVAWSTEDIAAYGDQLVRLYDWYLTRPRTALRIAGFEEEDGEGAAHFGCQAARDSIAVSANGEVSSCSKVLALDNRRLVAKLGDVELGLTHLANRAELVGCVRLREECTALGIAADYTGGCLAVNHEETGDLFRPSLVDHAFAMLKRTVRASRSAPPTSDRIA